MKKLIYLLAIIPLVYISSCSDDKDDKDKGPKYSFEDQDLQGSINNKAYFFQSGTAEDSFFEEGNLSIDLSDVSYDDSCSEFFLEGLSVFFEVPAQTGIYELSLDFSSLDGRTVTLYDPDETLNIICSDGAIEIVSISNTEVTGRLDARYDNESSVNGNFTVPYCIK